MNQFDSRSIFAKLMHPAVASVFAIAFVAGGVPALAGGPAMDWNQWRGPSRDGFVAPGGPTWPETLDHLEQTWRIDLDSSYSGPVVVGDRVFTTETVNKEKEVVRALDRATGKELWRQEWTGAMKVPFFAARNGSWIRATPACDGETVYVAGMRDVLVALDAKTGDIRWRVDFVERFKTTLPDFGFVSSPLVIGDHVYVQAGASFCKLDKKTGETVWRSLDDGGGMLGSAFSSPTLAKLGGREQMLVQTREKLAGVEPGSGKVLWSETVPNFRGMNILTPVVWQDSVYTSSYKNGSYLFRIEGGDQPRASRAWESKPTGYMSSPIVLDGYAYLLLQNQRFACVDLKTGEEKWRSNSFGTYWSLVAKGDRILALDERGELLLIHATPEKFDLLSKKKISEAETWAHLAVAGDEVFIRELNGLAAYRWK